MPDPSDIVITGMGMRCGVGNHAMQSCASLRAGISRFAAWKNFGGDDESPPLTASAVDPALGDEIWIRKAAMLLDDPLSEMLWQAELLSAKGLRAAVFLAFPDAHRKGTDPAELQRFVANVREEFRFPEGLSDVSVEHGDQTAGAAALRRAIESIQQNKADVCIVAGVDSLLHVPYLAWLHDQGRLKFGDASSGVIPGEAAACITLETRAHAEKRGVKPLARIAALAAESEGAPLNLQVPSKGKALTQAITQVLAVAQNGATIHRVYADLNGERWRFLEFALVNSRMSHLFARGWQLHHPADCMGDVGAAWIPASLCLAAHLFQRRAGGPGEILITAASDAGIRAALVVGPA